MNRNVDNTTGFAYHTSTLAGVAAIGMLEWQRGVTFAPFQQNIQTTLWGSVAYQKYARYEKGQDCLLLLDPREDVIKSLNTLMFYTGAAAATFRNESYLRSHMDLGLEFNTTLDELLQGTRTIYKTDLFWFLAAALIEGVCIALIIPTYWSWWALGRPLSFSPLEIAKVFPPFHSDCSND